MVGGVTQTTDVNGSDIGFKLSLSGVARKLFDEAALSDILEQALQMAERRAKGQVPYDTGELENSIGYEVRGLRGNLFATAEHAEPVEFGHRTRGGTMVAARPYLRPAAEDGFDLLEKLVKRHAEKVLGKG